MIWLLAVAGHACGVPHAAYDYANKGPELTRREERAMGRFGYCLCGPEGTVDWDPRSHKHGGYFAHPSCNRNGWNGRRYTRTR